ncbi:hypothetical protein [Leptolyngbya ohadii]|uniref:hypothetical protein n=1 Tax=Leptolyngbya ohadii TaxID=1962290 RepID=UPI000B5A22A1|nr:hypothetical protein [Leptolyngbya ohadii]
MVRITSKKSIPNSQQLLNQIRAAQKISRQDYFYLTSAILADTSLTVEERRCINRLFDDVQAGRLQLVD